MKIIAKNSNSNKQIEVAVKDLYAICTGSHKVKDIIIVTNRMGSWVSSAVYVALKAKENRNVVGLPPVLLWVQYNSKLCAINDIEDLNVFDDIAAHEFIKHEELVKDWELRNFVKSHNITAADLEFIDTVEFAELCQAWDIELRAELHPMLRLNVTHITYARLRAKLDSYIYVAYKERVRY